MTLRDFAQHGTTIVEVLRYRASHQPEQVAYTFLVDGEAETRHLTYQQLDQQAKAIAADLQSRFSPGERALLLYPPGLDYIAAFFACLYAGIIAVPAYPPRPRRSLARLQRIYANAQPCIALADHGMLSLLEPGLVQAPELKQLCWLATDGIASDQAKSWREPDLADDSLALLQYTSGSTGTPKGVIISHGNLMSNLSVIYQQFGHSPDSRGVIWLPPYHDMGLIGGILQPIYGGFPVILLPPVAFLQKPIRWLQAISRYGATTSGGPNFAYDLCVRKVKPTELEQLDLSRWEIAFNGAEPIRAETLDRFTSTFAACGFRRSAFYPCYGMAETTLFVTGRMKAQAPVTHESWISCGRPSADHTVIIVHPESCIFCDEGQIGEIWIAGASVASGYWNQPQETQRTFHANLANAEDSSFLRTGDLGFLRAGELFVTGRLKDIIIIRGQNYYPQDLELTAEQSHGAIKPHACAAFSVVVAGEERLVLVAEIERQFCNHLDGETVVQAIRQAISEHHQLQVYAISLLKPETIPKTSSGKLQRYACREQFLHEQLNSIDTWRLNHVEVPPPRVTKFERSQVIDRASKINQHPSKVQSIQLEAASRSCSDELISWLRDYASERINSRLIDERRCIPPYIVLDFGNRGLLGMQVPKKYGGIALTYRDSLRVFEQLAAIDLTLAIFVGDHHILGTRPILNYANEAVKEKLLPLIAQGRELAAFALTEPGAGSNPRAISATAIPDAQGGWRLNGQKQWIGSGSWAGVINVFVQMLDANHRPMGISGFVVRQGTNGLHQGSEALTMGMRGMVQNSIHFNDVSVNLEDLLGEPGAGMDVAQDAMLLGRLGLGVMSLGGMKRCAQLMLRYSSRRSISTGRLLDNPITLVCLNDLTAAITALETLVFTLAGLLDQGCFVPEELFIACKTSGPELLWQAADRLVQLLGGRGTIETNLAPQLLRDARLLRIFEGPTEALNMFLGSRVLRQGEVLDKFLCQTLGTPRIAQRLKTAAAQISDRLTNSQRFADRQAALQWAYGCIGEVATFAILWAVLEKADQGLGSEKLHRAIQWAELRFEQQIQRALAEPSSELMLADAVAAQISHYTTTIGDLEQTLAGEDLELDPFLRHQPTNVHYEPTSPAISSNHFEREFAIEPASDREPEAVLPNSHKFHETADSIQNWIERWLSTRSGVQLTPFDRHAAFTNYGMDSLMAVELVHSLQEWLQVPLDNNLLWNFPTTESLTQYLVEYLANQDQGDQQYLAHTDQVLSPSQLQEIPLEYYQFDCFPEYQKLKQQKSQIQSLGFNNPFFRVQQQVVNHTTVIDDTCLINYATYNYLGMSGNPAVSQAAQAAIARYGTSVSASRLLSGEKPLHRELERAIADFIGTEDSLVFVGGHATNVSTISHLVGRNDLILYDVLGHSSIVQGALLSGATLLSFPHNDWQALAQKLANIRHQYQRVLIVIEGIYSTDGDIPNLPQFITIKHRYKALLMVDEAHSIGVLGRTGRGLSEYFGIHAAEVDIWMGTLSKSLASCGGYIAGCTALIDYLKYTASGFIYSVGISPPNAAAALAALQLLQAEPHRITHLQARSQLFLSLARSRGINTGNSQDSPIVPVIVGEGLKAVQLAQNLFDRGINVQFMLYPAVPQNTARLRFFVSCLHTEAQICTTVEVLSEELSKLAAVEMR